MRLVQMQNGTIAQDLEEGDEVTTFRGDKYILAGWREPSSPNSNRHVFLEDEHGTHIFYPNVINAKFIR